MKHSALLALALANLLAIPAFAQAPTPPARHGMEGATTTRDQFMAHAAQRFDDLDTNHDGKITPDERQAAHQRMKERMEAHRGAPDMGDEQ